MDSKRKYRYYNLSFTFIRYLSQEDTRFSEIYLIELNSLKIRFQGERKSPFTFILYHDIWLQILNGNTWSSTIPPGTIARTSNSPAFPCYKLAYKSVNDDLSARYCHSLSLTSSLSHSL